MLRIPLFRSCLAVPLAVAALLLSPLVHADEAQIRKNLAERLAMPPIDEINKTPIPGLYEVRMGTEILYTDEQGNYLVEGSLIDTKARTNLTEARINKLTAIDFAKLPLKDAMVWKNGTGARRIAVFADPNCGYCRRFEADLQKIKDVTVYTFLYPILGGDSPQKSRDIWCSKEPSKTWLGWMLRSEQPPRSMGNCETPFERNLAMGKKYRINGTPALVFADGTRFPGAMPLEQIEKQLIASSTTATVAK